MKLETWLRMMEIPHVVASPDFRLAPKGKIPYIEDEGVLIGDSAFIIEHLVATRGQDPDAWLSRQERAVSLAFQRMLEDNLYWVMIQMRYREEPAWSVYREVLAEVQDTAPPEARPGIAKYICDTVMAQMQGHGMGRHTAAEIARIGMADLTAISDQLGDKPYFMGDRPSTVDASVYAHVASVIEPPLDSPIREHGRSLTNLVDYCARMRARYFAELPAG
jgi:glutathione S-transferase